MTIKETTMVFRGQDLWDEMFDALKENEERIKSQIARFGETPRSKVKLVRAQELSRIFCQTKSKQVSV